MQTKKNIPLYILAALIVTGFFVLLYVLIFHPIPGDNKDVLNLVVGALIACFTAVVNYFFGSSKGSSEKNELLKNQNRQ